MPHRYSASPSRQAGRYLAAPSRRWGPIMLSWLIALILFAFPLVPLVYPATLFPVVVTAGTIVTAPRCHSMRADFDVTTRFARDTARSDRAEGENRDRLAEGAGCGDGGSVTPAGVAMVVSDLWAAAIVEPTGVGSLTVAHVP